MQFWIVANMTISAKLSLPFGLLSLVLLNLDTYAAESSVDQSIYQTQQRFHAQIGAKGAVATQEVNATKVGLDILRQGGNAIDAAVAIGYALAVEAAG